MAESSSRIKGCLKYGCFGCLGLVVIAIGFGLVVAVTTMNAGPEQRERRDLSQELPGAVQRAATGTLSAESFAAGVAAGEFSAFESGRVIIDFNVGKFDIVSGPAGEPIRVEADFDVNRYKLEQKLERDGENGWVYRVSFGNKGLFKMFQVVHGNTPRLTLVIPRNMPFALQGEIGIGESDLELGGLWLTEVDLELGMGDHRIGFGEPLPEPIESFAVTMSAGSLRVARLGNASPAEVDVRQSMGEMRLDLRGRWVSDTRVNVRCSMGECAVTVPRDINVDLKNFSISLGEKRFRGPAWPSEQIEGAPRMEISARQTMGELTLSR